MKTGIVKSEKFLEHKPPGYHPENPQRLKVIHEYLEKNWREGFVEVPLRSATDDEILLVHSKEYLNEVKSTAGRVGHFDADTYYSRNSSETVLLAVGSILNTVDAIFRGEISNAFAFVRPPGHHAERDRAMGFCIFNNVAISARYAQKTYGIERVLIVDWDLHHGNGTQWAFYSDPTVLYFSTHQYPYYPGTGAINECGSGKGEGFNINVPLPPGMGDNDYTAIFNRILLPITEEFMPEFIIISAGFDAHRDDPLGGMALTEQGYAILSGIVNAIAQKHAKGRVLYALEGGYNLEALKNSVASVLSALQGKKITINDPPSSTALEIIERVIKFNKRYWKNL
jgi:acetoin utilization deacetylase AcuC-like enzyme